MQIFICTEHDEGRDVVRRMCRNCFTEQSLRIVSDRQIIRCTKCGIAFMIARNTRRSTRFALTQEKICGRLHINSLIYECTIQDRSNSGMGLILHDPHVPLCVGDLVCVDVYKNRAWQNDQFIVVHKNGNHVGVRYKIFGAYAPHQRDILRSMQGEGGYG